MMDVGDIARDDRRLVAQEAGMLGEFSGSILDRRVFEIVKAAGGANPGARV